MKDFRLVMLGGVIIAFAGIALMLDALFSPKTTLQSEISYPALMSISLPDIADKPQALGQWQGKLLAINFWATWCAPCREEIPVFSLMQEKYAAKGLQIVGIAADKPDKVVQFLKTENFRYPALIDLTSAMDLSKRLGNRLGLLPHTIIFNAEGKIVLNKLGQIQESELENIILRNLAK
jgi:thiol-disulfide isomerase/thioredoxin